jgi:hypothetical protein
MSMMLDWYNLGWLVDKIDFIIVIQLWTMFELNKNMRINNWNLVNVIFMLE